MYFYEPVGLPLESLRRSLEHLAFRALHVNVYHVRIPIGGGEIVDRISLNDFRWPDCGTVFGDYMAVSEGFKSSGP